MIFQDVVVHASASSVTASTRALSAYRFPVICAFNLIYVHVHRLRVRVRVSGDLENETKLVFSSYWKVFDETSVRKIGNLVIRADQSVHCGELDS